MTAETHPTLDLRRVVRALQRWAWLIAALVVGSFVVIYATSSVRTAMYTSTSEVRITPLATAPKDPNFLGNEIYNIRGAGVRQGVAVDLGSDEQLIADVEVNEVEGTDVISIHVSSSSPEVARDLSLIHI